MLYEVITIAKPSERGDLLSKFPDPVVRRMVEVDLLTIEHYEQLLVITSYSIHYTKLYEARRASAARCTAIWCCL